MPTSAVTSAKGRARRASTPAANSAGVTLSARHARHIWETSITRAPDSSRR